MKMEMWLQTLETEPAEVLMEELYGSREEGTRGKLRFQQVLQGFFKYFGPGDVRLFSSPGRTELGGNHTDHNQGCVLAGSIQLDAIGAAAPNGTRTVHMISETFGQDFTISLEKLEPANESAGTVELVKGMLRAWLDRGYPVEGFDAYISSNVISSAGVSSSASFEMLVGTMINEMFCEGCCSMVELARIGQFAEQKYWKKGSGLLDQMACGFGGMVAMDFKDPVNPVVEKLDFDFASCGHKLMIVQTGRGHADLSAEYSSIPEEMKRVAGYFGKQVCRQISEEEVLAHLPKIRAFAGDRAVLRALHFFRENQRVQRQVEALKAGEFGEFLRMVQESGSSSWRLLQNCYVNGAPQEQGITVALALTEQFLEARGVGACRVHGGGFAGVIMALVPDCHEDEYKAYMEGALGEGCVHAMVIRKHGAICLDCILEQ